SEASKERFTRICHATIVHFRKRGQLVVLNLTRPDNVQHPPTPRDELVSDQSAMASPGQRLGTHNRRPLPLGKFDESFKCVAKFARQRIVGVGTECLHAPARVWGRLDALTTAAP